MNFHIKFLATSKIIVVLCGMLTSLLSTIGYGQTACETQAGQPEATCIGCTSITGDENINNGEVYCFNGTSLSVNSITINAGGTLKICSGVLNIDLLSFNGGIIIVNTGATLNVGFDPIAESAASNKERSLTNFGTTNIGTPFSITGSQYIVNHGTFTYLVAELTLNGTNALVQNNEGAVMNLKSLSAQGNGRIINGGELNVSENLRINANGNLCLLKCAVTTTLNLYNQETYSVVVGPNPARPCISYSGNAEMNAPLSGSIRLTVCKATGATVSGGASIPFGFAQVNENCASCITTFDACEILLPITFERFEVKKMNSMVQAAWAMSSDVSIASCSLEGSSDGVTYSNLKTWNSNQLVYDVTVPSYAYCLFRIKAITSSGSVYYSAVDAIDCADLKQSFFAWTQPAINNKQIQMRFLQQVSGQATISIADAHGRKIHSMQISVPKGVYTRSLDLNALGESMPHGIYFVSVQFRDGQHYSQKLIW